MELGKSFNLFLLFNWLLLTVAHSVRLLMTGWPDFKPAYFPYKVKKILRWGHDDQNYYYECIIQSCITHLIYRMVDYCAFKSYCNSNQHTALQGIEEWLPALLYVLMMLIQERMTGNGWELFLRMAQTPLNSWRNTHIDVA